MLRQLVAKKVSAALRSEKKNLTPKKNHSPTPPPLEVKWMFPNDLPFRSVSGICSSDGSLLGSISLRVSAGWIVTALLKFRDNNLSRHWLISPSLILTLTDKEVTPTSLRTLSVPHTCWHTLTHRCVVYIWFIVSSAPRDGHVTDMHRQSLTIPVITTPIIAIAYSSDQQNCSRLHRMTS